MPKTQITPFTTSNNLKAAMAAVGLYPAYTVDQTAWISNAVQVLFLSDQGDGTYRTIATNGEFDFLATNDPALSRVWSFRELMGWFAQYIPFTDYSQTTQGANTTITYKVNGTTFTATNNNPAEALASTILTLLKSPASTNLRK